MSQAGPRGLILPLPTASPASARTAAPRTGAHETRVSSGSWGEPPCLPVPARPPSMTPGASDELSGPKALLDPESVTVSFRTFVLTFANYLS